VSPELVCISKSRANGDFSHNNKGDIFEKHSTMIKEQLEFDKYYLLPKSIKTVNIKAEEA